MDILKTIPRPVRRAAKVHVIPRILRTARWIKQDRVPRPVTQRFSVPGSECFQGYYDIRPVSDDSEGVLAHVVKNAPCRLGGSENAAVGYFEVTSGRFVEVAQTRLWSWQLGARLMWGPGPEKVLAFNTVLDDQPCYALAKPGGSIRKLCDVPLFDVNFTHAIGVSLNFGRLAYARPGYGYGALEDPFLGKSVAEQDGLSAVDLNTGQVRQIVSMPDIAALMHSNAQFDLHYLNAAKLSATGKKFSVLYKTIPSLNRPHEWNVNAVVGSIDGTELSLVPLPGKASHYWWIDDQRIVFTSNKGRSSEYLLFDSSNGELSLLSAMAPTADGHPSLHAASGRWVTDTYPDLYGEQHLFVLNGSNRQTAGVFRASTKYVDECRCDLHPRWSDDGRSVFFDSTHEGFRAVYRVDCDETAS